MKYNNIAGTLGWEETPDSQEGLFLQPEEAAAVDTALASVVTAEKTAEDLATANSTIETLNGTVSTLHDAATTSANRITELEGQVAELGKKPSGAGSTVHTAADEVITETSNKKAGLNSPDHALNKEAARRVAAAKKK